MTQLGIQKDVWGIIEKYSNPKLWWYWCRDPKKRGDFHPQWFDNMADEFKVIEADSEHQAHFLIYKASIHNYIHYLKYSLFVCTWRYILEQYSDLFNNKCTSCTELKTHIYSLPEKALVSPSLCCDKHTLTGEMLLFGQRLIDKSHWTQLDNYQQNIIENCLRLLTQDKWVIIKQLNW